MSIPPFNAFAPPPTISKGNPLDLPEFSRQVPRLDLPPPPPLASVFLTPSNFSLPKPPPALPDRELAPAPKPNAFTQDPRNFMPPALHNPTMNPPMPLSPNSPQRPPYYMPNASPYIPPTAPPASAPSSPLPSLMAPATTPNGSSNVPPFNPLTSPPTTMSPPPTPMPSTPPDPQAPSESIPMAIPASIPPPVDLPPDVRGFDDGIMRSLNLRLEDPDWMRRADAANDYFIILSSNPNLEKRPQFKPYVDAFALKILRDPSSVVHEAMLRAMQVGCYRYPSPEVLNELNRLRDSVGMLGLEAQLVDDAISGIQKAQIKDAQEAQQQQQQVQVPPTQAPHASMAPKIDSK